MDLDRFWGIQENLAERTVSLADVKFAAIGNGNSTESNEATPDVISFDDALSILS